MITEHNKIVMSHLRFKDDEKVSDELAKFIEDAEKMLSDGCKRNNFSRETIVAMLALLKELGREKILEPVKKVRQPEAVEEVIADENIEGEEENQEENQEDKPRRGRKAKVNG